MHAQYGNIDERANNDHTPNEWTVEERTHTKRALVELNTDYRCTPNCTIDVRATNGHAPNEGTVDERMHTKCALVELTTDY